MEHYVLTFINLHFLQFKKKIQLIFKNLQFVPPLGVSVAPLISLCSLCPLRGQRSGFTSSESHQPAGGWASLLGWGPAVHRWAVAGRAGQTLRLHLQHRARPLLCARERRHAITASWAGADPGPACAAAPPPPPQETDSAHLPAGGGARSGMQPGRVVVGLPGGA